MIKNKYFVERKVLFALIALLFVVRPSEAEAQSDTLRVVPNNAFGTGEKLFFDIDYGFFTVGEAVLQITNADSILGRKVYRVISKAKSKPFFDAFFKVRDKYESYIDSLGIFSWRFEQHVREGSYRKDYGAFLNQLAGIAISGKKETEIPPYTQDIISAFYYTRTVDFSQFEPGEKIQMYNFFADKVYPLAVVYHGKEKVKVEAGTFDCIVIEPLVTEGGLFKNEGSILIWLTDDDAKMPVKVSSKVLIGSITAELTKYENVYGKLTSKK